MRSDRYTSRTASCAMTYVVLALIYLVRPAEAAYPLGSLRCVSTLNRPDLESICPEARNKWCVKEVSNLPLSLCGKTQYYGDSFINGECQYKKCDSECEEGQITFRWDEKQYTRTRFCCNTANLCNSALGRFGTPAMLTASLAVLAAMWAYFL